MEHECEALVINCIDFRFWEKLQKYLKEKGVVKYDLVGLAGGAKTVVDEFSREIIFKQLEVSVGLHRIKSAILVNHIDCGAYGGSKAFKNIDDERAKLIEDLNKATEIIKEKYPKLEIRLLLNTCGGVEEVKTAIFQNS